MKFVMISPKNRTAYNFRGDLIKKIIDCGYEVIVTGPNYDNVEKIQELGASFTLIPMNKNGLNPIADLKYLFSLYKLLRKEKPDITFGYTSKPVIYGSLASKLARVPRICAMVTGVGYAFTAKSKKAKIVKTIMSMLYRIAFASADIAIFQNKDDKNNFVSNRLVKEKKAE